jgi:hypothetical protein
VTGLPTSFVIDRDGMVRLTWSGEISMSALENTLPRYWQSSAGDLIGKMSRGLTSRATLKEKIYGRKSYLERWHDLYRHG